MGKLLYFKTKEQRRQQEYFDKAWEELLQQARLDPYEEIEIFMNELSPEDHNESNPEEE